MWLPSVFVSGTVDVAGLDDETCDDCRGNGTHVSRDIRVHAKSRSFDPIHHRRVMTPPGEQTFAAVIPRMSIHIERGRATSREAPLSPSNRCAAESIVLDALVVRTPSAAPYKQICSGAASVAGLEVVLSPPRFPWVKQVWSLAISLRSRPECNAGTGQQS